MSYFANAGPKTGPILWRDDYEAIGVLEARADHMLIGTALLAGWGSGGAALWRLIVDDVELPGRWIVVGREFRPER
jgi:hypothetical protein